MSPPAPRIAISAELRVGLSSALASFGRETRASGARYAREGRVQSLSIGEFSIAAMVLGGDDYQVEWRARGAGARAAWIATCTCPVGISCKHAAAVAEGLLGGHAGYGAAAHDSDLEPDPDADLDAEIIGNPAVEA
jgi:uncharacterized Zn finger protein